MQNHENVSIYITHTTLHLIVLRFFIYRITLVLFILHINLKIPFCPFSGYTQWQQSHYSHFYMTTFLSKNHTIILLRVKCISASLGKSFHAVMSYFSLGINISLCWVNVCSCADISHFKSVSYATDFSFLIFEVYKPLDKYDYSTLCGVLLIEKHSHICWLITYLYLKF